MGLEFVKLLYGYLVLFVPRLVLLNLLEKLPLRQSFSDSVKSLVWLELARDLCVSLSQHSGLAHNLVNI